MMLEVKSTCEGSAVTQLLRTDTWGDDEVVQRGELTVSSFETNDGKSFQFTLHNEINGHVVSDFKGSAKRDGSDQPAAIKYEHDAFPDSTFPAGGVFPNQYMERLLDAADQNQRVVSVTVFDGSDESKIYRSTSIIGPKDTSEKSGAAALKGMAHWPMVLSYFDVAGDSITPDYESSFDLYANGVSDHVLLDYGDFAMKGEITSLQLLQMPKCK
jgi:hypothetical protein